MEMGHNRTTTGLKNEEIPIQYRDSHSGTAIEKGHNRTLIQCRDSHSWIAPPPPPSIPPFLSFQWQIWGRGGIRGAKETTFCQGDYWYYGLFAFTLHWMYKSV